MKIYLVGGAIRNQLLGLKIHERDWVVVGADAEQLKKLGYQQVGKDFPVFLHPKTKEEYALARTERKTAPGYHGFAVDFAPEVTLEEDLIRRDLTINAIAQDLETQALIDPYGGVDDIKNRIIRHVSDAFVEDPLRLLRLARFYAQLKYLGFRLAPETLELLKKIVESQELLALTPERVWMEFEKALKSDDPSAFIEILRECGALKQIFPELDKLWGIPQRADYHPEVDTGIHIMMVMQKIRTLTVDPIIRFAALCHDLGKGMTPSEEWPSHKLHEIRGVPLINNFCERYRVPNDYHDLAVKVSEFHLWSHTLFELRPQTILKLLHKLDVWRREWMLEGYILACQADSQGRLGMENKLYPQAAMLRGIWIQLKQRNFSQELLDAGFSGKKLGEEIDRRRVNLIKNILDHAKK